MTLGEHENLSKKERDAAKPLIWTHPLVHRVATADLYNDSYVEIRDEWSTGDLVEGLRHVEFHTEIKRIQQARLEQQHRS